MRTKYQIDMDDPRVTGWVGSKRQFLGTVARRETIINPSIVKCQQARMEEARLSFFQLSPSALCVVEMGVAWRIEFHSGKRIRGGREKWTHDDRLG